MHIPCVHCGQQVYFSRGQSGIISEGTIVLNIPGIVCGGGCVVELLDFVPDPPGLISVMELSSDVAASAMTEMEFVIESGAAVDFFLQVFPTSAEVIDTAAIRLHQEGNKEKAYNILECGINHSDDIDRLRLEIAAFAGMDEAPQYGLQFMRDVNPDTPRYFVIKGNLFRAAEQWDEAAVCWQKAIETDPSDDIAWFNLGCFLLQVKKSLANAEQHFQRACDAFPEERRFRAYLGDALFLQGRKIEALREYHRALPMQGGDSQFEVSLRRMIDQCGE